MAQHISRPYEPKIAWGLRVHRRPSDPTMTSMYSRSSYCRSPKDHLLGGGPRDGTEGAKKGELEMLVDYFAPPATMSLYTG